MRIDEVRKVLTRPHVRYCRLPIYRGILYVVVLGMFPYPAGYGVNGILGYNCTLEFLLVRLLAYLIVTFLPGLY